MVSPLDAMRVSSALTLLRILKADDAAESGKGAAPSSTQSYLGVEPRSSALRTGNALGTVIEVASRGSHTVESGLRTISLNGDQSLNRDNYNFLWGANGTISTTSDGKGGYFDTFSGMALGMPEDEHRQHTIENLEGVPPTPRTEAWLAAVKNGKLQEIDLTTMGVESKMTSTIHHYADGSTDSTSTIEVRGLTEFKAQHTEIRDGILYDKETGKFAAIGQNGSKYTYSVW